MKGTTRITVKAIEGMKANAPERGQAFYRDSDLIGFGVRVNRLRSTYIVERRVGKSGPTRRIALGDVNVLSLDEARRQARETISKLANGIDLSLAEPTGRIPTFADALADYLERDLRPSTKSDYRYWASRWLFDWLHLPITEITEEMAIARNRGEGVPTTKTASNRTNGGKTQLAQVMALAKSVMQYAKNRYKRPDGTKILTSNPVAILSELRERHSITPRRNFVSASQLPAFYEVVSRFESLERAFYLFLVYSGFRREEARLLRWTEVDMRNGVITLPDDRVKTKHGRSIPITRQLRTILEAMRADQAGLEFVHVFANTPTSALPGHRLTAAINAIKEEAAIIDMSNHGLRRTYITHAKRHMHENDRKLLVGHALDVTGRYDQTTVEDLAEPAQRAADGITKLMTGSEELPADLFAFVPSRVLTFA